jgi:hypothetical protein
LIDNQLKQGNWLDKHGIVYKGNSHGYLVNELEISRDRFTEIFGIACQREGEP